MKIQGALGLSGYFNLRHYRNNELLDEFTIHNTITDLGKAEVAGLINEQRTGGFKYLAIGTSGTEATSANTALLVELAGGMARAAATCTLVTTDVTDDTAQLVHTFSATATYGVREIGVFDTATTGGRMLARQTFDVKSMVDGDTLTATYKIDVD